MTTLMPIIAGFLALFALLPSFASEQACKDLLLDEITRDEVAAIIAELKKPHKPGQYGPRILTDEPEEAPDPDRPYPLQLPDGRVVQMIGLSGGKAIFADDLTELFKGGVVPISRVALFNESGHKYASEVDENGRPLHYAHNSSLWDVYAVQIRNSAGELITKIFGGGMADDQDGRPLLPKDGASTTRQRLFFDGEFQVSESGDFRLIGKNAYAPLNPLKPVPGEWVRKTKSGYFYHGYGGGPITLLNGELYTTEDGWVPYIHEQVIEARTDQNTGQSLPWLTVQAMTPMDPELNHAVGPSQVIWSPLRKDGTPYKAALRPSLGGSPLTEGLHLVPKYDGKPIESSAELARIRAEGKTNYFDGMHSHGEYYGEYGGSTIRMSEDFKRAKPSVDSDGQIHDFLKVFSPIAAWRGRPVSAYADLEMGLGVIRGQEYVLAHFVDRSKVPAGIAMNKSPSDYGPTAWEHFNRQVVVFPIQRIATPNGDRIEILDNTGLLERLAKLRAPDVWAD